MASPARRLDHNAPGDFFVDSSCIDCDTCRWMAPETFIARDGQASVARQPDGDGERLRAEMALLSCPTASIGTLERHDLDRAQHALPDPVDGPVFHCGYHDEASFGATSYLVVRPEGNLLVDCPRFTAPLVRRIEAMGGVRHLFLTHRDDVGDHRQFRERFGCERILHARDVTRDTRDVERVIEGEEPVELDGETLLLPVPGHTPGSTCLLFRGTYLFTGDHLAWSPGRGHVYAFRDACWYSWTEQITSMRRLAQQRFEWVLPGHGRRCHFPPDEMAEQMERAVLWMDSVRARA
jgi:glyoxylase-like metal-dependent hydrolase (beta-lactamase superfamily II)/ferredoxin